MILSIIICFLFFGCKKDQNLSLNNEIIGRWYIISKTKTNYSDNKTSSLFIKDKPFYEFRNDKSVTVRKDDTYQLECTYEIEEPTKFLKINFNGSSYELFKIQSIEQNVLKFRYNGPDSTVDYVLEK